MRASAARRQRGFALLAMLVLIVVAMILAVAAVGSVNAAAEHARIQMTTRVLIQLLDSSRYSIPRFQAQVGEYPGRLSQLRFPLVSGDKDICGIAYNPAERGSWNGDYTDRAITTAGMGTGIGVARDSLAKDPLAGTPTIGSPHALVILIDGVNERDAYLLNTAVDGEEETPATLGRVRWGSANSQGTVVLQFRKTITEC